jgi:hypothetical protein
VPKDSTIDNMHEIQFQPKLVATQDTKTNSSPLEFFTETILTKFEPDTLAFKPPYFDPEKEIERSMGMED